MTSPPKGWRKSRRRLRWRKQPLAPRKLLRFGGTVTILRDDGREQTFRIVGEDEADPSKGTLSHASPLARALFGKKVGDVVPAGSGEAEIVSIGRSGES
jgi:transcription elongation GreA/GreB family factor